MKRLRFNTLRPKVSIIVLLSSTLEWQFTPPLLLSRVLRIRWGIGILSLTDQAPQQIATSVTDMSKIIDQSSTVYGLVKSKTGRNPQYLSIMA